MGSMGSTTSVRAREMRRVLARWQRSGLTLREFGEKSEIPLSTLTWWRRVFQMPAMRKETAQPRRPG
jgi:hypothetical protein